jgi:hypothetical protein
VFATGNWRRGLPPEIGRVLSNALIGVTTFPGHQSGGRPSPLEATVVNGTARRGVLIAAVMLIGTGAAQAATAAATVAVSVTITSGCAISVANAAAGVPAPNGDPRSVVAVSCTSPTPYAVGIGRELPHVPSLVTFNDAMMATVTY